MTRTRWKKASTAFSNTVLALLIALALLLALFLLQSRFAGGEPSLGGYRLCFIRSGSMEPAVKVGSAVLVQPRAAEDIRAGDIITFRSASSGAFITHRVDHIDAGNGLLFYTKGDANNVQDPMPVMGRQLVGKVALTVPYLGYLLACAGSREGLLALFALAALILAGGLIRTYTAGKKQRKQNAGGEVAAK